MLWICFDFHLDTERQPKADSCRSGSWSDYAATKRWIFIWNIMAGNRVYLQITVLRIRDQVPFWPLDGDPVSGIGFFRILDRDLGSRIPNPYFWEVSDKFLGKKFYNSLKTVPNFFLQHVKNKIIFTFVKFVATKKIWQQIIFHPSLLLLFLDPRSEIRDG